MSNPSRAVIETGLANSVKLLDETRRFAGGSSSSLPAPNATTWVALQNTAETALAGDFLDDFESVVWQMRNGINANISPSIAASIIRPWLKQYCKSVIGLTDLSSDEQMLRELYRYLQANARFVTSRNFTFGTSVAQGSPSGNGQILRLTRDKYNFPMEGGYVDQKRLICIADENTGRPRGREVFQIEGQTSTRDQLERSGSGALGQLAGLTLEDSLLNNPGFRSFGGTAGGTAPTSLDSWTSTNTAGAALTYNSTNYGIDQTNTFRTYFGDGTAGSLVIKVSARITQKLTAARQTQLSPDTPYLLAVVWNAAVNSAVGTLNIRMGSVTTTVTVSGQTGWNVTTVPSNIPLGQSCWYRQFAQNDLQFQLEWIQTSGTGILIAEVLMVPGTAFDSTWYWALPASTATFAQWRVLDEYRFTDIATGSAKIQTWIHRAFPGFYMPSSNGSSVSIADV